MNNETDTDFDALLRKALESNAPPPEMTFEGWGDGAKHHVVTNELRRAIEFPDLAVHAGHEEGLPRTKVGPAATHRYRGPRPFRAAALRTAVTDANAIHVGPRWRSRIAVVIDDEEDYACLLAYCLHRENYRAVVCTTSAELDAANQLAQFEAPELILQDIQLPFEDWDEGISEDLQKRAEKYRHLFRPGEPGAPRVLVFSAHPKQFAGREQGQPYLDKLPTGSIRRKPLAGFHALRAWIRREQEESAKQDPSERPTAPGHSASGRAQASAIALIARARWLREHGSTTCDWLRGAFVVTQAMEILDRQTATLALEALSLQHQFEALVECRFFGINYDFSVNERVKEIETEIDEIAAHYEDQERAKCETLANVLNDLVIIYRSEGQFEAEATCLARLRDARVQARACATVGQHWWARLVRWPPPYLYVNAIVARGGALTLAICANIVVLTVLFRLTIARDGLRVWGDSFAQALLCFFTVQPPTWLGTGHIHPDREMVIALLGILSGYLHLGVLISYLYARFSRR